MKTICKILGVVVVLVTIFGCVSEGKKVEQVIPDRPDDHSHPHIIIPAISAAYMTISPEDLNFSVEQCLRDQKYKNTSDKVS